MKEKKKLLSLKQKEAIPGSVGGFSSVDICPAVVTTGLRFGVFKLCLIFKSFFTPSH